MKKVSLIIISLFCIFDIYAQINPQFTQTPSTSTMMNNNFLEMDEFRGKANINIPLFAMSIGDQEIPFLLYYNTGGVKVGDNAGNIGMNWSFTGESKIVRKQIGLPDDLQSYVIAKPTMPTHIAYLLVGLGWSVKEAFCLKLTKVHNVGYIYSHNMINSDVNNFNTDFGLTTQDYYLKPEAPLSDFPSSFSNNKRYIEKSLDTAPDEFTVFLPNGDTFVFMYDHVSSKMKALNANKYKIKYDLGTEGISSFTIVDPTGISYNFQETEEMYLRELTGQLETEVLPYTQFETAENKPLSPLNICDGESSSLINEYKDKKHTYTWHLTSIESYSSTQEEKIIFEYDDVDILDIGYPTTYMKFKKATKQVEVNKTYVHKNWIKTKQLKRIYNNLTQVDFLHTEFRQDLISAGNYSTSRELGAIEIYDKKQLLFPEIKIIFKNSYVVSNESQLNNVDKAVYKRLFLNDIEFYRNDDPNGLFNKYSFEYNNASGLPNKHSLKADMFGYYKGGSGKKFPYIYHFNNLNQFGPFRGKFYPYTSAATISTPVVNMVNHSSSDFESKLPNPTYTSYGSLVLINDFYGKETKLVYENNKYINSFGAMVLSGGVRIKKIEERDTNTNVKYTKSFTYNNDGRGFLENVPILGYESKAENTEYLNLSNKPFNYTDDFNSYYPLVKTVEGEGEYGYMINKYTYYNNSNIDSLLNNYIPIESRFYRIYNTHNDVGIYNIFNPELVSHHFNFTNTTQYPFIAKTNLSLINGYKVAEELYNSNNKIVKETHIEYNIEEEIFKRLSTSDLHGGYELQYFFTINPKVTARKDYASQNEINNIESRVELDFDDRKNVISEKTYDTNGNELRTEYTYPYNYPISNTEMNSLNSGNLISNFITKETRFNNEVLYLEKNKYSMFNNKAYLTEKTLRKYGLMEHSIEKINQYDSGKIVEYTDKSGNNVSVIWGYNKSLPVAEITGVKFDQIQQLLTQINFNNLTLDSFDIIRNQFPKSLVTNYTYHSATSKLLTGKKSSNGEKIFYRYNSKGYLYKVIDEYNNTLEQYEYNHVD